MLESMIALALTALIITFTFPSVTRNHQITAERQFWNSFRQEWREAQVRAKVNHEETAVTYHATDEQIEFSWWQGERPCRRQLNIPETLLVRKFEDFKMHENGYTRPRTQEFQSSINQRTYLMRIQLAWGGYHIETK